MTGSPPWINICRSWTGLKRWLLPSRPANLEAWRALPLWQPHVNHIDPTICRCGTVAQKELRAAGFSSMADVTDVRGILVPWARIQLRGIRPDLERAYNLLIWNLKNLPELRPQQTRMPIYLEGINLGINEFGSTLVWKFLLPAAQLTETWIPFLDRSSADSTYLRTGLQLLPRRACCPGPQIVLHRIIVGAPGHSKPLVYFGPWQDGHVLTQYQWTDGNPMATSMANTSTTQLRLLQVHQAATRHCSLAKWEVQLQQPIPKDIWESTWMSFRSAIENTFLWQIIHRVLATQTWRFPGRPAADPDIWCSRYSLNVPEDTYHCIWGCPREFETMLGLGRSTVADGRHTEEPCCPPS